MRLILVRLSALGDIVHTWPLASAIRSVLPQAHITWVVEEPLAPLVDGHPAVDATITTASRRWRKQPFSTRTRAEIAMLKSRFAELAPDLTIDAQGTVKSAAVTHLTGAPRRVGLARPWRRELAAGIVYNKTIPGPADQRHVIATNLELIRAVDGSPPPDPPPPDGRWLLDKPACTAPAGSWKDPYGVLLPGAGQPDKILAAEALAEVARFLVGRGLGVVVAWGPSEKARAVEIAEIAGDGVDFAPPTGLLELSALLAGSSLVVGGDTGPVHLAASLGVPTLGVFLTTDPQRNGPRGARIGVVSGAAPGRGPGGSATTGSHRRVSSEEICAGIDKLLTNRD